MTNKFLSTLHSFPLVSVVIVNWNKRHDVLNLLDSLQSITYSNVNFIVIDNASTDGSGEAIRNHLLPVTLIENTSNLGGTGGFNTGIRHALKYFEQKYIWLLDNDAEVRPDTLEKLIAVMEEDVSIGISGSCILNPADRTLIVEAGGLVDEQTATWKPNLRFQPYENHAGDKPVDVDYVPACSALVRKDLFDVVGLLDERYFLHWDDVDFGRTTREKGFRVVAVFDSIVFHGSEKGYSNAVLYYDVRNSLLFISKHLSLVKRILPMFRVCLRGMLAAQQFTVFGEKLLSWYLYQAFESFTSQRFGVAPSSPFQLTADVELNVLSLNTFATCKKVVIFAVGSFTEITSIVELIRSVAPCVVITLAAPSERIDSYRFCGAISHFISYDLARGGIWGAASVVVKLLRSRFDCAVSAGSGFIIPFAFFVRRHVVSADNGNRLLESKVSLNSVWKLPFIVVAGIILSMRYTATCWLASQRSSVQ
jgi:GT2 family glycosyltransferase